MARPKNLFKTNCSNFIVPNSTMPKLKVAFKHIYKVLFNKKRQSITGAMVNNCCDPIDVVLGKLVYSFQNQIFRNFVE